MLANDNIFNRAVLKDNALYYGNANDICALLNRIDSIVHEYKNDHVKRNWEEIRTVYSWEKLIDEHEKYFKRLLNQEK